MRPSAASLAIGAGFAAFSAGPGGEVSEAVEEDAVAASEGSSSRGRLFRNFIMVASVESVVSLNRRASLLSAALRFGASRPRAPVSRAEK